MLGLLEPLISYLDSREKMCVSAEVCLIEGENLQYVGKNSISSAVPNLLVG